jgi:multiple sugar transport system ATP-binding protein
MGDHIAVMKDGQIQQYDKPETVYDMPASQFVGGFIGTPPMNFMQGQVQRENGHVKVKVGDFQLSPAESMEPLLRSYDGSPILMGIRAENMETLSKPAKDALQVEVLVVEPLGSQNLLTVKIGDDLVKVATHPTFRVEPGTDVWLRFPADKIRWVDRENGKVLYPPD